MAKGWHREPRRHALASRGVKTAIDNKPIDRIPVPARLKRADTKTLIYDVEYENKDYELVKAHHPTAFEKGIYAVHFHEKGKPYVDRYSRFTQVKAKSREEALSLIHI